MAEDPKTNPPTTLKDALDRVAVAPADPQDQGDIAADDAGGTALAHRLEEAERKSDDVGGE